MIPPNAAPPKTLVIDYPAAEEKVRKQYVYQAYLPDAEVQRQRIVPGNRLIVKFKEDTVGEGQAILVEPTNLERLSAYDAMIGGFENVEALRKHLAATVLRGAKKPAEASFYRLLFRWL